MKELLKDGGKLTIESKPVGSNILLLHVKYRDINMEFFCTEQKMEYQIDVACLAIFNKLNDNPLIANIYMNELLNKHRMINI